MQRINRVIFVRFFTFPKNVVHKIMSFIFKPIKSNNNGSNRILSPVSGVIKSISSPQGRIVLGVYIRGPNDPVEDDHNIYDPISSKIGYRVHEGMIEGDSFFSSENKTGFMEFRMDKGKIKFEVYVGAGYVTNQIKTVCGET